LHGRFFDLRALPGFDMPIVFTLHDAWLLSGHCAHSFDCDRWRTGCGHCPDLRIYPAIRRDATAYNFRRKQRIYRQTRLYISTPCQWLMDKVQQSMLADSVIEAKVIPYGVDLDIFAPGDKSSARAMLNLPQDARILLFSASSIRKNDFKDYDTMRAAVKVVAEKTENERVIFLALGEDGPPEPLSPQVEIRFVPFVSDLNLIADYYRAADVYIHAARADTFPNAVLESLACGTPVIGSDVGGIPEEVNHEKSGMLVPVGDAAAMAAGIIRLLEDDGLRASMGQNAASDARHRFDLSRQIDAHLNWYAEIVAQEKR
jgi:glycosyltransferase involved in cell wall biosynthesis